MSDMLIAKRKHTKNDGSTQWLPVGMTLWVSPQQDGSVRYSISDNRTGERFSCFPLENRGGSGGGQRGQQYPAAAPQYPATPPPSNQAPPPHMPGAQPYDNVPPPDVPFGNEPTGGDGYGKEPDW